MSYRSLFLFRESCIATVFWGYFRVTILVLCPAEIAEMTEMIALCCLGVSFRS